jgi:PTS system nitrogen regulatory IIA component
VYDWAQKGEIPGGKFGTAWRFKKSEIEKWVNDKLTSSSSAIDGVKIQNLLSPDRIIFLDKPKKELALDVLIDNLCTSPYIKDARELKSAIYKREEIMSCAIGKGIAIPHVRLTTVTDLAVSIGISSVDVEGYVALDEEPVRILIMIASAYNQHAAYLHTLSFFSQRLKKDKLREALLAAKTKGDVYNLMCNGM